VPASTDYATAYAAPLWVLGGLTSGGAAGACFVRWPVTDAQRDPLSRAEYGYPRPVSFSEGLGPSFDEPLGDDRFVLADQARGLRVLDASAPAGSQLSEGLMFVGELRELRAFGDRALLITQVGHEKHALHWVELKSADAVGRVNKAAPRLLVRLELMGDLRGVYTQQLANGQQRAALVTDVYDASKGCQAPVGTVVRMLSFARDAPELSFEVALGKSVRSVSRSGELLFVQSLEFGSLKPRARLVHLAALKASAALSAEFEVGDTVHALHAAYDARSKRWIATLAYRTAEQTSVDQRRVDRQHVRRVAFVAGAAPEPLTDCVKRLTASAPESSTEVHEPPQLLQAVLLPEHALLVFDAGMPDSALGSFIDTRTCATTEHTLQGRHFVATPDAARLIGLSPTERPELNAALYVLPLLDAPVARVQAKLARPGVPATSVWRGSNSYQVMQARWHARPSSDVLSVPFTELDAQGVLHEGSLLLIAQRSRSAAREAAALTLGGKLKGRLRMFDKAGLPVLRQEQGLALHGAEPVDAWPRHVDAELLAPSDPDAACPLARLRWPSPRLQYDPLADTLLGQLEFVEGDRDMQLGAASATFPISGNARLDRVGSLLVATSQYRAVCRIEVFDASDITRVRKTAVLDDSGLCDTRHALDRQPSFAIDGALVFVREVQRRQNPNLMASSQLELRILELREPNHPTWRAPILTPEPELATTVLFDAAHQQLYYAFRMDKLGASKARPEVHYYVRAIDPSAPIGKRFGERISVPGEPIRLEGELLYTRHGTWQNDAAHGEHAQHVLRSSRLRGSRIEPVSATAPGMEAAAFEAALWNAPLSSCRGASVRAYDGVLTR
jgi:hypothetical protein